MLVSFVQPLESCICVARGHREDCQPNRRHPCVAGGFHQFLKILGHFATCLLVLGRYDEALQEQERARQLDPLSPWVRRWVRGRLATLATLASFGLAIGGPFNGRNQSRLVGNADTERPLSPVPLFQFCRSRHLESAVCNERFSAIGSEFIEQIRLCTRELRTGNATVAHSQAHKRKGRFRVSPVSGHLVAGDCNAPNLLSIFFSRPLLELTA